MKSVIVMVAAFFGALFISAAYSHADRVAQHTLTCDQDGNHNFSRVMMPREAAVAVRFICQTWGPGTYPGVTLTVDLTQDHRPQVRFNYTTQIESSQFKTSTGWSWVRQTEPKKEVVTDAKAKQRKSNPQGKPSDTGGDNPSDNDNGGSSDNGGGDTPDDNSGGNSGGAGPSSGGGSGNGNGGGSSCNNGKGNGGDGCNPGGSDNGANAGQDD